MDWVCGTSLRLQACNVDGTGIPVTEWATSLVGQSTLADVCFAVCLSACAPLWLGKTVNIPIFVPLVPQYKRLPNMSSCILASLATKTGVSKKPGETGFDKAMLARGWGGVYRQEVLAIHCLHFYSCAHSILVCACRNFLGTHALVFQLGGTCFLAIPSPGADGGHQGPDPAEWGVG